MRSLLAVPADNPRFVAKAAASEADAVFLDLEDAVVPERKVAARAAAIAGINGTEWGARTVAVRVNDLTTPWAERDVVEVAEACPRLDIIILPKCESPDDVRAVDAMLQGAERVGGRTGPVKVFALVESARGIVNAETTAGAGGRLGGIIFGPGDYALDLGVIDAPGPFEFALARLGNAARAFGIAAIDGPWTAIADTEGMTASCRRAAGLGYQGKMCIHPTQIGTANEAFSPSARQVEWARQVVEAMAAAGEQGRGAVKTRDGEMVDLVHIKIARAILARAPT